MNIIFCYSDVPNARAAAAIGEYAPDATFVDTSVTIYDYGQAIASRWNGHEDLVVIEGDKEISADTIPSLAACNELWCTFGYKVAPKPYTRLVYYGLGCAKFSAQLQRITSVAEFICEDLPWYPCIYCHNKAKGCWRYMDLRLKMAFGNHGINQPHVHGEIPHHHTYDEAWYEKQRINDAYLLDTEARMRDIQEWQARQ